MRRTLARTLLLSIVLPIGAIQVLLHFGIAPATAVALATLFPLLEIALEVARTKRVSLIAGVSFAGMATGFALSSATGNPVFLVLKDSTLTFVFGCLFLGSLLAPKPLIYQLRLEMSGNDDAARAKSEALWAIPAARTVFRRMTIVWGAVLILEAIARVPVSLMLPLATAATISPIFTKAAVGGLALWTFWYARYARTRRPAAGTAAAAI